MANKKTILGFQVMVFPEDGTYSSIAPELGIADQGDTQEEALANLKEAIELHLECLSEKELDALKTKLGKKEILSTKLSVQVPA